MANLAEYTQTISNLKSGKYAPIYLLHGDEPFFIDKVSHFIEKKVLAEHERDFNQHVFYGRDLDIDMLRETLRRFPVMAERQVVIVREAQDFKDRWADFIDYFNNPSTTTILVLDFKYKKADGKTKWVKAIKKNGVVMESKKVYESDMPGLIDSFVKGRKYRIEPRAVQLMVENIGMDLEKAELEIEKLTINVPLSKEITVDDVKKNIGNTREYSRYEYLDALSNKDHVKSYKIAQVMGKNDKTHPIVLTVSALFDHFSKTMVYHSLKDKSTNAAMRALGLWIPFQVQKISDTARNYDQRKLAQIISELRIIDSRSKGASIANSARSEDLLKELTYKILN